MSTELLERPATNVIQWGDEEHATVDTPRSALDALTSLADTNGDDDGDRRLFGELADELAYASRGLSSTRLAAHHPAYAEILAIGERCIPWLLERLEAPGDRPIWLRLLSSLTRFQPGAGKDTIPEAAAAWVAWGKLRNAR
jgi:hypothetical protein